MIKGLLASLLIVSGLFSQTTNIKDKTAAQVGGIVDGVTIPNKSWYDNGIFTRIVELSNASLNRSYNDQDYATLSAGLTDANADTATFVLSSRHYITADTTLAGQYSLIANRGSRFNVAVGSILTIDAPFWAGSYQVFEGNIDSVRFGRGSVAFVDPKWFGALGDSSNADASAFQAAIDALPLGGGIIRVLPGNYDFSATTVDLDHGVAIIGSGPSIRGTGIAHLNSGVTRILYTGGDFAFDMGDGTYSAQGALIKNIVIDGEATGDGGIRMYGTSGSTSWGNRIENVKIQNIDTVGVEITENAWSGEIINLMVPDGIYGIDLKQEANDFTIINPDIDGTTIGIRIGQGSGTSQSGIRLIGPVIQNCSLGVYLDAPTLAVAILDPYFEGDSISVSIPSGGASPVTLHGGQYVGIAGKTGSIIVAGNASIDIRGLHFLDDPDSADVYITGTPTGYIGSNRHASTADEPVKIASGITPVALHVENSVGSTSTSYWSLNVLRQLAANSQVRLNLQNDARIWQLRTGTDDHFYIRDDTGTSDRFQITTAGVINLNADVIPDTLRFPSAVPSAAGTGKVWFVQGASAAADTLKIHDGSQVMYILTTTVNP